jgi:small-conductance mechanosensitive channel
VQAGILIAITLLALSNLGINIGAVIAGLGIGGIAVALAAQNVLGDLLASLSIVLDRPFVVGDFIVAGNERGTIEYIGIKTTRLRSLSGEEVVLSNKDLLESRIHNFKRMWRRRVVQKFGVVYSTPAHQLEMIPTWVKEIVTSKMQVQFDRCHFFEYADSSLNYELVFFVDNPEYNFFMDIQQSILIDIFKKFSSEKVSFAYPSQSLYIEKVTSMV